jgi:predicted DNA-binding helix-hairpin-helix protein
MDALEKLKRLGPPTRFEPAEEVAGSRRPAFRQGDDDLSDCVHHAVRPDGKRIALLKTLLTSACERNCRYCAFRQGRDFRRVSFSPDELARLVMQLHGKRLVEGIFLSSGVAGGGPRIQDRLIATAEILRRRYDFRDYIHLKIMPGAERDQVLAAMRLADRVSINLEAPNAERLAQLSPHKIFHEELLQRLRWIEEIRQQTPGRWPSSSTQFVVGAAGESDAEILVTTGFLYRRLSLARAYFSRFSPVPGTPLESHPPTSPLRERRLYQSSFLLRDYGFAAEELSYDAAGNLSLGSDPKLAPQGAERLLRERRRGHLRHLSDLRKLGIVAQRTAPFVLLDGRRPPRQLSLWPGEALDA